MTIFPTIYGFKLTAKLNKNEPRLFEEIPDIRLRVGKNNHDRFCLFIHDTNIEVPETQFDTWVGGWL